ncbi:MAG: hypothetical protein DME82_04625 [Verrucomicrobia bacterium]|nr:MAG: hypothetical protein DME82_04625 [Verrucomicrobiota bacterium]
MDANETLEMTKHEWRTGERGRLARCVTRLAGHSSGDFRRGAEKSGRGARAPRFVICHSDNFSLDGEQDLRA